MVNLALSAGETLRLAVTSSFPDFVAGSATAILCGPSSQTASGTVSGTQAVFTADTAAWAPGTYAVEVWGTSSDNEKRVLERGTLVLAASLASAPAGYDPRTANEKALAAIEAMLAGTATQGVKSYTINNRTLDRYSMGELLQLQKHYAALVAREKRLASGRSTLGPRIAFRI